MVGTTQGVQTSIAAVYSNLNLIYVAQFNIWIQVDGLSIQSATGGPTWNNQPPTGTVRCTPTINDVLTAFTSWRTTTNPTKDSVSV